MKGILKICGDCQDISGHFGILQSGSRCFICKALECFIMHQGVLGCFMLFQNVSRRFSVLQDFRVLSVSVFVGFQKTEDASVYFNMCFGRYGVSVVMF